MDECGDGFDEGNCLVFVLEFLGSLCFGGIFFCSGVCFMCCLFVEWCCDGL